TIAEGLEWHVIVGTVNNQPYELFAVNGRQSLPEKGIVVRKKKKHYSLLDEEGNILIDNLAEEQDHIHPQVSVETRRFSLELRHGIHPKFIVSQIDKSNATITSFTKAASRILTKKYITEDELMSIS